MIVQNFAQASVLGNRFSADLFLEIIFYTINEAHQQYSLLDTILNYILYCEPPGNHLYSGPQETSRPFEVTFNRLVAKPGCWEIGFRQISLNKYILYHK